MKLFQLGQGSYWLLDLVDDILKINTPGVFEFQWLHDSLLIHVPQWVVEFIQHPPRVLMLIIKNRCDYGKRDHVTLSPIES